MPYYMLHFLEQFTLCQKEWICMGFGVDDPSTSYHLSHESFGGGENYCWKAKRKNLKENNIHCL